MADLLPHLDVHLLRLAHGAAAAGSGGGGSRELALLQALLSADAGSPPLVQSPGEASPAVQAAAAQALQAAALAGGVPGGWKPGGSSETPAGAAGVVESPMLWQTHGALPVDTERRAWPATPATQFESKPGGAIPIALSLLPFI